MKPNPQVTLVTRRWLLSSLSASFALVGSGGMTYAEGGGRSENLPPSSRNIANNPPKKKSRKISVIYTQKNLKNVKDKDLKTAILGNKQGHSIVIEGFSKEMSSNVFEMMLLDRNATLTFIRSVANGKTLGERLFYFNYWEDEHRDYIESLIRKRKMGEIDPENIELRNAKKYLNRLYIWRQSPMQGLLNKPQKKKPAKNRPKNSDTNAVTDFFTNLTGTEAPQNEETAGSR